MVVEEGVGEEGEVAGVEEAEVPHSTEEEPGAVEEVEVAEAGAGAVSHNTAVRLEPRLSLAS